MQHEFGKLRDKIFESVDSGLARHAELDSAFTARPALTKFEGVTAILQGQRHHSGGP